MKIMYPGHTYLLDNLDSTPEDRYQRLQFVQRAPYHSPCPGTTCQEVLRCVIDRVKILDAEIPHPPNAEIIFHLRMAIALFEARALLRHIEKHDWPIENALLGEDGHLLIPLTEEPKS